MLFNSFGFIFAFLPLSLVGYHLIGRFGAEYSVGWLAVISLFFYAYWDARFLPLMLFSILFNYYMGQRIANSATGAGKAGAFPFAIFINLALLATFKYLAPSFNFLVEQGVFASRPMLDIILPLGISFFTFTQIGYLVDRRDGLGQDLGLSRYIVFVTFFPHLIAGPILHIRDMAPQLIRPETFRLRHDRLARGLMLFTIGLVKKVLLADPLSAVTSIGYAHPGDLSLLSSWITMLGYSLQLYFDFSGYCDMAIGLAEMFGFTFPVNFNSPYKSRGGIDFWQRWHMTLSRYLTLLLYNPVALWVSRRRAARGLAVSARAVRDPRAFMSMIVLPTFFTMTIAGIWHGAGIHYIVFGVLHAVLLTFNHLWRVLEKQLFPGRAARPPSKLRVAAETLATFLAVTAIFVFFRADSCADAWQILSGAIGIAAQDPQNFGADRLGLIQLDIVLRLAVGLAIVWGLPNSQEIMARFSREKPDAVPAGRFLSSGARAGVLTGAALVACMIMLGHKSEFLYFQF